MRFACVGCPAMARPADNGVVKKATGSLKIIHDPDRKNARACEVWVPPTCTLGVPVGDALLQVAPCPAPSPRGPPLSLPA